MQDYDWSHRNTAYAYYAIISYIYNTVFENNL